MAHPHSVAVGGYYPTPPQLIPPIAALIRVEGRDQSYPAHQRPSAVFVDPCAGDGAAVFDLAAAVWGTPLQRATGPAVAIYAAEAERERARALRSRATATFGYAADKHILHGDSFRVTWNSTPTLASPDGPVGAGLLWLNPPYSAEAEHGRLEDRFLRRWTDVLTPGSGMLVYIVPWYALRASSTYLAQHYAGLHCFRFPDDEFAAYQQVVLLATRRRHTLPEEAVDDSVRERLTQWSTAPEGIPQLPRGLLPRTVATFAPATTSGLAAWQLAPIDLKQVYSLVRPWQSGTGGTLQPITNQGFVPVEDLIGQPLPVAQPLRDVHLALALASGLLNGYQVEPDDPTSDLPPLLVKGVFEREFRTTEEKTNKDGEVTALVQVQQPKMRVCVLDLKSYTYHELLPGAVPTGTREIGAMNIADLIAQYGYGLGRIMAQQCPPLHHPAAAAEQLRLPPLHRPPFTAQTTTIQVLLKLLWSGENPFLIGEVGVGKSLITLATAAALTPAAWSQTTGQLRLLLGPSCHPHLRPVKHVLIVCPPHLLASWSTQVMLTLPGAHVVVLEDVQQLEPVQGPQPDVPGQGLTIFLLSRETGKLGSQLASGLSEGRCPRCFQPVALTTDEIISQRARCTARRQLPTNALARLTLRLAQLLVTTLPENALVRSFVRSRLLLKQASRQRARYHAIRDPEQRLLIVLDEWYGRALGDQKTPLLGSPLGQLIRELEILVMNELQARAAQALLQCCVPLVRQHWPGLVGTWCQWVASVLVVATRATDQEAPDVLPLLRVIGLLWWSVDDPERDGHLAGWIEAAYEWTLTDPSDYGTGSRVRRELRLLLITLHQPELRDSLCRRLSAHPVDKGYGTSTPWSDFTAVLTKLDRLRLPASVGHARPVGDGVDTPGTVYYASQTYTVTPTTGTLSWNDAVFGTPTAARLALDELRVLGTWRTGPVCHEPLFQATPHPRRFPIATFIARYRRRFFQLLIIDEAHEYKTQNSAQERAAHRLTELPLPTILASGSFMSGYVRSVHANCWAVSHGYRQEFGREDAAALITRYGYRKVLVEVSDKKSREAVSYGRTTDRIATPDTVQRNLGEAPGMLPVFLLKHILNRSAMIHKADLHADLPGCTETPVPITVAAGDTVGQQLLEHYGEVQRALVDRIKADRWDAGRVGKLWGAMSELPSLLDRLHTDTGNDGPVGKRCYSVRYPPSLNDELVATAPGFAPGLLLPKEQWLLELLRSELDAGRNVIVFVWHTGKGSGLVEHLHRMIRHHFGDITVTLDAGKVKTGVRERWIDEQVVAAGKRVLLVNPTTVQTGLNNLVHFATAIWWENPQCDAVIYRQANGRLDRLGQRQPVHILFPYYQDTAQEIMLDLLGRKIAASLQLDGLNVVSALEAVGADQTPVLQTLEIGRAIYERLLEASEHAPRHPGTA